MKKATKKPDVQDRARRKMERILGEDYGHAILKIRFNYETAIDKIVSATKAGKLTSS